ncbi:MAG: M3 family metallopeptidase [Thermomicrobiales bacterium]
MSDSRQNLGWDLASIYRGVTSSEFKADLDKLSNSTIRATDLVTSIREAIRPAKGEHGSISPVNEFLYLLDELTLLSWKLDAFVAANLELSPHDQEVSRAESLLSAALVNLATIRRDGVAVLAGIDWNSLVQSSRWIQKHPAVMARLMEDSRRSLDPAAESLAGDLRSFGVLAWARLRRNLVASATTPLHSTEGVHMVTVADLGGLAASPDREKRRAAYEAECSLWSDLSLPLAQTLNSIKGEAAYLSKRRGWPNPLAESSWRLGLDELSLNDLISVVETALPVFHRFLRAKAALNGSTRLAWFDLQAVVEPRDPLDIDFAASVVTKALGAFSPVMGSLAQKAFREGWIDAKPRPDKPRGGLCYWIGNGESRIRVSFNDDIDGLRMLAHELGHAYHYSVLIAYKVSATEIEAAPIPLMECASKFCEQLVYGELSHREAANPQSCLAILDARLTATYRSVVESLVLFRFEEQFYSRREHGELAASEINEILLKIREELTGGALNTSTPFPWTWASLPHLYLLDTPFYNLPYLIAQLLGVSLCGRYLSEPDAFRQSFDAAIARVGSLTVAEFAAQFGPDVDLLSLGRDGLSAIAADVDQYEGLIQRVLGDHPTTLQMPPDSLLRPHRSA